MPSLVVIDEIYEAAVVPGMWLRVLDRMTEIGGGQGTLMFADEQKGSHYICSPAIRDFIHHWASDGWIEINERGNRLIPIDEPRFLTDLDAFTAEELDHIPIYRDLFRKWGLGWCVGTAIRSVAGSTIVFSIERRFKDGPVEREAVAELDLLRPHLARAAVLSAKVGLERAWSSVTALQAVDLPAAVLAGTGRALAANPLLLDFAPDIAIGANDRLSFANRATQALYMQSLSADSRADSDGASCSFPLPASGDKPPAVVHLLPLRGAGRDLFTGAGFLLYVTVLSRHSTLSTALLQALFDLTPAEARVARLIGSGLAVGEVAQHLDIQANTVRAQLKSVFAKTGLRRQADLLSVVKMPRPQKIALGITQMGNEPAVAPR